MEVKNVRLSELKEHPRNPRVHPDSALDKLVKSIKEYGWTNPVLVSKDGYILAGHARCKAAKKVGLEEVPVIFLDLEGEKADAYLIADNKIQEETDWDTTLLCGLLKDLEDSGFDVSLTGFDATELDNLFNSTLDSKEAQEDDFDTDKALEEIETPISQPGDIWLLGRHRLICGDSTSSDDMAKLVDGVECDLVLTDPPYNVDYTGKTKDKLKIQNDKMGDDGFLQFLTDAFTRMYEHSKKGAAIYVFHADSEGYNFRTAFKLAGYTLRQCLVWVKNSMVMGRQDYQWKHEPILYGWKDGASHAWYSDRKQTTVVEFNRPQRSQLHPTTKPVGLIGYFINNSCKAGDIILDPFGGSGSTLIACEQTERVCYTSEIDPNYADVIVKRYIENAGTDSGVFLLRDGKKIPYREAQLTT